LPPSPAAPLPPLPEGRGQGPAGRRKPRRWEG
jgi:hypothetical protein